MPQLLDGEGLADPLANYRSNLTTLPLIDHGITKF